MRRIDALEEMEAAARRLEEAAARRKPWTAWDKSIIRTMRQGAQDLRAEAAARRQREERSR